MNVEQFLKLLQDRLKAHAKIDEFIALELYPSGAGCISILNDDFDETAVIVDFDSHAELLAWLADQAAA